MYIQQSLLFTVCSGRYLVCGSDSASLYLEVLSVEDQDILCEAKNGAVMDGLMTVSHALRAAVEPRQASHPWGCNTANLVTNLHIHNFWQAVWNHNPAFCTACFSACWQQVDTVVPCDASQVFHMERSSNSLLNLQNTLPLFRWVSTHKPSHMAR